MVQKVIMEQAFLVGFFVTVVLGLIMLSILSCFGPQYVRCDCGNRCKVSEDGWFYWECEECGESGKAKPF